MMRASIRLQADGDAEILARTLTPETQEEISRNTLRISGEKGELVICIEAEDIVALRAALNSYLRWTQLAIDTKETLGVLP